MKLGGLPLESVASRDQILRSIERLLGESVEIAGREGTQRAAEHLLRGMCESSLLQKTDLVRRVARAAQGKESRGGSPC